MLPFPANPFVQPSPVLPKPKLMPTNHLDVPEFFLNPGMCWRSGLGWLDNSISSEDGSDNNAGIPELQLPNGISKEKCPSSVDLRGPLMPSVYSQMQFASCTANAVAGMVEYLFRKEGHQDFVPSRLFIYYYERMIDGKVLFNIGAELCDGLKVVTKLGCPNEALWPYDCSIATTPPNEEAVNDATRHKIKNYYPLQNTLIDMKTCLASGYPFVFGFHAPFKLYLETCYNPIMRMPLPFELQGLAGMLGHAVMAVGYDDSKQLVTIRNSMGDEWGDKGYFYMPYSFITSPSCKDFWTACEIQLINSV